MASFTEQIRYHLGDASLASYSTVITQLLSDAAIHVVNTIVSMNPTIAWQFSGSDTYSNPTTRMAITGPVLQVLRLEVAGGAYHLAREIPADKAYLADDTTGGFGATKQFPVYWVLNGEIEVHPEILTESGAAIVVSVKYGAINDGAGTVSLMPPGVVPLVPLLAAIRLAHYKMGEARAAIEAIKTGVSNLDTEIAQAHQEAEDYTNTEEDSELTGLALARAGSLASAASGAQASVKIATEAKKLEVLAGTIARLEAEYDRLLRPFLMDAEQAPMKDQRGRR